MAELNKVLLIGNLTRNPEIRYTQSGSAVCELGMAINRTYNTSNGEKKKDVCFVDVNVWGNQAEACNRYLQKGSSLFVEGRLNFDQWDDKETGKKRSRLRVVAERTQFLNTGRNEGGNENHVGSNGGANQFAPPPQAPANNPGTFPPPPPAAAPQAPMEMNNQASSFAPAPAGMPTQPAPAPAVAPQPPAQPIPAQTPVPDNNAFNTNMGSEDDIPF